MAKKNEKNSKDKTSFTKKFKAELKKVIWPTPKQLVNNTVAVVTIVLTTAIIVFVLDVVFDMGNKYGISHLQSIVNDKYNNQEDTENTDSGDENATTDETTSNEAETTEQNTEDVSTTDETTTDSEQTNPEQ
mgnify:CR=1 FL=1